MEINHSTIINGRELQIQSDEENIVLTFTDSSTLELSVTGEIVQAAALQPPSLFQEQAEGAPFLVVDYPLNLAITVDGFRLTQEMFHQKLCGFILESVVEAAKRVTL